MLTIQPLVMQPLAAVAGVEPRDGLVPTSAAM
jgi:hypothetical protein